MTQAQALSPCRPRRGRRRACCRRLLVEAERIAATVILGEHGRKRAGPGESFWQYRPYSFGNSTQRIDWHKSARSDRVFIRENEWEAANTLWVWASPSVSMDFNSHLSQVTKRQRAQLLALAVASLAVRAQERVSALGSPYAPDHARGQLVKIAGWFLKGEGTPLPSFTRMPRFSSAVLAGDFFDTMADITRAVTPIAQAGVKGHIVQVVDPAEETLPYAGRVEFQEMAGPLKFLSSKAETLRGAYAEKLAAHRAGLRDLCNRIGWSFSIHRTDESPTRAAAVASCADLGRGGAMNLLSALSFTTPLALAALLLLPVIWWLLRFTPPRPETVRFPPIRLLLELANREEQPDKTPWWLLLLRLLVAAFIIFAVSHPLYAPGRVDTLSGAPLLLVVDDSWAAAKDWDKRREIMAEILDGAASAGATVTLATTTPQLRPQALEPQAAADAATPRRGPASPAPWTLTAKGC